MFFQLFSLWGQVYGITSEELNREITKNNPIYSNLLSSRNITVSGQIVGSDNPQEGIEGAFVKIDSGDSFYITYTDDNGIFSISEVSENQIYELLIMKKEYQPYLANLEIESTDLDLGILIMQEIPYPPEDVLAVVDINDNWTEITWRLPIPQDYYFFDFDNENGGWVPTSSWSIDGDWEWTDSYEVNNWYFSDSQIATPPPTAVSGAGLWGTKIYTNHTNSGGYSYISHKFNFSSFYNSILRFWSWNDS